MNTKFDIGQRVTYPVTEMHEAKIDAIQIGKDGKPRYSVGGRMVLELELKEVGVVFEKPEPVSGKPDPVKLYCVKDFVDSLSRGKIYETDKNGHITYDHGGKSMCAISDPRFQTMNEFLVPLVKRPAKIGEWVYIVGADTAFCNWYSWNYKNGDVMRITSLPPVDRRGSGVMSGKNYMVHSEYLVLDGYHGDLE
jgi:hypothetical protein